jgi:hypothetical protein
MRKLIKEGRTTPFSNPSNVFGNTDADVFFSAAGSDTEGSPFFYFKKITRLNTPAQTATTVLNK